MFSLHQNPLAIVQQQAASLHMLGYCSITLLLPPAHSFNRPRWLTCYIKMISTVISISPQQPCKMLIYYEPRSTAGWILGAKYQHWNDEGSYRTIMDLLQLILGYLIPFKKDESFTHTMKLCKSFAEHESYSSSLFFKLKLEQRVEWVWVKICKNNVAFKCKKATNTAQIFRGISTSVVGHTYVYLKSAGTSNHTAHYSNSLILFNLVLNSQLSSDVSATLQAGLQQRQCHFCPDWISQQVLKGLV